mmetsp:Transcript_11311/g.21895  ORF Transcript_11311/g.21895 Transcript_11311/m.21895 type:complete len:390 (+) Transcript_11311:505-1674(+)
MLSSGHFVLALNSSVRASPVALRTGPSAAMTASLSVLNVCRASRRLLRRCSACFFSPGSAFRKAATLASPSAWISGSTQASALQNSPSSWPARLLRSWLALSRLSVVCFMLAYTRNRSKRRVAALRASSPASRLLALLPSVPLSAASLGRSDKSPLRAASHSASLANSGLRFQTVGKGSAWTAAGAASARDRLSASARVRVEGFITAESETQGGHECLESRRACPQSHRVSPETSSRSPPVARRRFWQHGVAAALRRISRGAPDSSHCHPASKPAGDHVQDYRSCDVVDRNPPQDPSRPRPARRPAHRIARATAHAADQRRWPTQPGRAAGHRESLEAGSTGARAIPAQWPDRRHPARAGHQARCGPAPIRRGSGGPGSGRGYRAEHIQ